MELTLGQNQFFTEISRVFRHKDENVMYENPIPAGMDNPGIQSCLVQHLQKIESNGQTLIIYDPYLFPPFSNATKRDAHAQLLYDIIAAISPKALYVGYENNPKKYCGKTYTEFRTKYLPKHAVCFDTACFHDRFWICFESKKGVSHGASLNGIGKRISLIHKLETVDVNFLLGELRKLRVP